jgi:PAS domain S-box-containing protein
VKPLKVLIAEDSANDAELMVFELEKAGYDVTWQCVQTEADFEARLDGGLQLILADYSMPRFSALGALDCVRRRNVHAPVIIVTGTIGEDIAAECIRRGAADYLLKDRLGRLATAVDNALEAERLRTDERRALADLRDSEERYRILADNLIDVIWVLDRDLRFAYVSPSVTSLLGFTVADVLGRPLREVLTPPSLAVAMRILQETGLESARSPARIDRTMTLEHVRRDGSTVWAEVRASVFLDAGGRIARLVGSTRDVTERRDAEQQLRLQVSALTAAGDGIAITDAAGRIEWVNPEFTQLTGYAPAEITGQTFRILHSGRQPSTFYENLWNTIQAGRVWRGELVNRRKNGALYEEEQSITPVRAGDEPTSPIAHYVAIKRDISLRKRAEDAIKRSNDELQHFAYVVSHDLQEPLRMVTSYVQLLARRYASRLDTDADDFIHYAVDGATRMQQLIHDLLTYSRVGAPAKDPAPCSAELLLQAALDNLAVTIADSGAVVTHDALPRLMADEVRLTTVFQNLVANAVKFRGAGAPRVHVSSRREDDGWVITIQDNGIGIDPRHFNRLFRMFQRLHTRDEFPGTGAGLAICKRIVERHGGRIWVESAPGQGSTFAFSIPDAVAAMP